jgi:hypothetical protein
MNYQAKLRRIWRDVKAGKLDYEQAVKIVINDRHYPKGRKRRAGRKGR